MKWHVTYLSAIDEKGELLFPQKLSREFLNQARAVMGSYIYENQYMNRIIPLDMQTFKRDWFVYYKEIPKNVYRFIYIDPALSEADGSDYTGICVVAVDTEKRWYVEHARRYRLSPTQLIEKIFKLYKTYKPQIIGIEQVAYQKALLYFLDEEMRRRKEIIPIKGITPSNQVTKQTRILSIVPRLESGRLLFNQGLYDLESELLQFPRAAHDDLIDSLASIEYIYYAPDPIDPLANRLHVNHKDYEKQFIQSLKEGRRYEKTEEDSGSHY